MPHPSAELPIHGIEVTIERDDGVLLRARCEYPEGQPESRVWWVSLPDADTTIDESRITLWYAPV